MVTYLLFRITKAIERTLLDLRDGKVMPQEDSVDFEPFEQIVGKPIWQI